MKPVFSKTFTYYLLCLAGFGVLILLCLGGAISGRAEVYLRTLQSAQYSKEQQETVYNNAASSCFQAAGLYFALFLFCMYQSHLWRSEDTRRNPIESPLQQ